MSAKQALFIGALAVSLAAAFVALSFKYGLPVAAGLIIAANLVPDTSQA